jgi:hypothetical protein
MDIAKDRRFASFLALSQFQVFSRADKRHFIFPASSTCAVTLKHTKTNGRAAEVSWIAGTGPPFKAEFPQRFNPRGPNHFADTSLPTSP